VTAEVYRFPGEIAPGLKFADVPNGIAAINAIPFLGWAQMFFLIGAVDYYGFLGNFDVGKPNLDPELLAKRQTQELQYVFASLICRMASYLGNVCWLLTRILSFSTIIIRNGRLAMLACAELFRHDSQNLVQPGFDGLDNLITGLPFLYN
jgi:hypothetical protein